MNFGTGSGEEYNPFAEANVAKVLESSSSRSQNTGTGIQTSGVSAPAAAGSFSGTKSMDPDSLAERERELNKKLEELHRREEAISNLQRNQLNQPVTVYVPVSEMPKNYPPFPEWTRIKPWFYINIEAEIPVLHQKLIHDARKVSYVFLLLLIFNSMVMLTGLIVGMSNGFMRFVWSVVIGMIMIPVSLYLSFIRLYNAVKSSSSFSYLLFLIGSIGQIIYLAVFVVGLTDGVSGWGFVINNLSNSTTATDGRSKLAGGLAIIPACASTLLLVATIMITKSGYDLWRSSGGTVQNAQNEMNRTLPVGAIAGAMMSGAN